MGDIFIQTPTGPSSNRSVSFECLNMKVTSFQDLGFSDVKVCRVCLSGERGEQDLKMLKRWRKAKKGREEGMLGEILITSGS